MDTSGYLTQLHIFLKYFLKLFIEMALEITFGLEVRGSWWMWFERLQYYVWKYINILLM
jgi:hypothetical protein